MNPSFGPYVYTLKLLMYLKAGQKQNNAIADTYVDMFNNLFVNQD